MNMRRAENAQTLLLLDSMLLGGSWSGKLQFVQVFNGCIDIISKFCKRVRNDLKRTSKINISDRRKRMC